MDFKASIPYIFHPFGLISTWFKLNLKGDWLLEKQIYLYGAREPKNELHGNFDKVTKKQPSFLAFFQSCSWSKAYSGLKWISWINYNLEQ